MPSVYIPKGKSREELLNLVRVFLADMAASGEPDTTLAEQIYRRLPEIPFYIDRISDKWIDEGYLKDINMSSKAKGLLGPMFRVLYKKEDCAGETVESYWLHDMRSLERFRYIGNSKPQAHRYLDIIAAAYPWQKDIHPTRPTNEYPLCPRADLDILGKVTVGNMEEYALENRLETKPLDTITNT